MSETSDPEGDHCGGACTTSVRGFKKDPGRTETPSSIHHELRPTARGGSAAQKIDLAVSYQVQAAFGFTRIVQYGRYAILFDEASGSLVLEANFSQLMSHKFENQGIRSTLSPIISQLDSSFFTPHHITLHYISYFLIAFHILSHVKVC